MKHALFLLFHLLVATPLFAQLDGSLLREAENWKGGDTPPLRLLKFPDGKIEEFHGCGMRVIGSGVDDYIAQIKNPDLLAALLLDDRCEPETLRATANQLITLKGTDHVARLLADHHPDSDRSELAVLAELLRSPHIAIQVARITGNDLEAPAAERALQGMRADLEAGGTWADAYGKAAEKHPNLKDRAKDPQSVRTLVGYLYDGVVSPSGFDILTYRVATDLPPSHLQEIFRRRHGTYVLKAPEGVYLYHLKSP